MSTLQESPNWTHEDLLAYITVERLGSYLGGACDGDLKRAFQLYEWNMRASASVMELTSMIEVIVRNALDRELKVWAARRQPGASWFDIAPLDTHGRADVSKARSRATRGGKREEVHGRVIADLSLGFWRYLVESRYLTALWVPATHAAFAHGPEACASGSARWHFACSVSRSFAIAPRTTSRSTVERSRKTFERPSNWLFGSLPPPSAGHEPPQPSPPRSSTHTRIASDASQPSSPSRSNSSSPRGRPSPSAARTSIASTSSPSSGLPAVRRTR